MANQNIKAKGVLKYDGLRVMRAGLPALTHASVTQTTTSTLAQYGTYYFYWQIQHTDNRGNIIDGPLNGVRFANPSDPDPFLLPEPLKVVMTGTNTGCSISLALPNNRLSTADEFGYQNFWGAKLTGVTGGTRLDISGPAGLKIYPGDTIWVS